MLRNLLIAALVCTPLGVRAEPAPSSESLGSFIAVMGALSERCAKFYPVDAARSLAYSQQSREDGERIYSKEYFGEVLGRERAKLYSAIDNFGERAWCFETRGRVRDSAPALFPADAPAR